MVCYIFGNDIKGYVTSYFSLRFGRRMHVEGEKGYRVSTPGSRVMLLGNVVIFFCLSSCISADESFGFQLTCEQR